MSPYIQNLIDEVVKSTGDSRTATLERLLYQIELLARHDKLPETIGLDFYEATQLINARGLGARHVDPVERAGGEHVDFDVALLETSGKSKCGYAGVQATSGGSFRALVPDVEHGGSKYLPSRPTALRAAIDRFEWFERYGLPYGNVGWHVEQIRNNHPEYTIDDALKHARDLVSGGAFGLKNPYTVEDVDRVIERRRELHPPVRERVASVAPVVFAQNDQAAEELEQEIAREVEPKPRLAAVPDVVVCCVCDTPIEDGEPFGPHGKSDYAHASCLS